MDDFWIERRYSSSGYVLPEHHEHCYQLLFITNGRLLYEIEGKEYDAQKGDLIVLNTLERHSLKVLKYPYERYLVQVNPVFFQNEVRYPEITALFVKRPADFRHLLTPRPEVWDYLFSLVLEMEKEYKARKDYWDIYVGADLRKMFITLFRECPEMTDKLKLDSSAYIAYQALNYLDNHYLEEITIDRLSSAMNFSKHYLSHIFKEETGYSPMDYVISLRVNRAKTLLSNTDKNISEIALDCGYTDFSYFSKQFRKKTGIPPKQFREQCRKEDNDGTREISL